jgi:hypothetical protein
LIALLPDDHWIMQECLVHYLLLALLSGYVLCHEILVVSSRSGILVGSETNLSLLKYYVHAMAQFSSLDHPYMTQHSCIN